MFLSSNQMEGGGMWEGGVRVEKIIPEWKPLYQIDSGVWELETGTGAHF